MDDVHVTGVHSPASEQPHGPEKMPQHTARQQDLQPQQHTEGRLQRCRQRRPIAQPDHATACAKQHQQHPRHQLPGAPADALFQQHHDLGGQLLADAFQEQDLEEHRADEHQRGKQMQGQKQRITHERPRPPLFSGAMV